MEVPIFKPAEASPIEPSVDAPKTVEQITSDVASQHPSSGTSETIATGRKKRSDAGRPRVRKNSLGMDSTSPQNVAGSPNGEVVGYTLDKAVVEKTAKVVIDTIDLAVIRRVYTSSIKLGGDKDFSADLAKKAGLTVPESEMIGTLTGVIFEKHGWLTGYAPEILLCVLLGEWTFRVGMVLKRLNQMEADAKARSKNVATSSPNQDSNHREVR
jgi:hypothetical protein